MDLAQRRHIDGWRSRSKDPINMRTTNEGAKRRQRENQGAQKKARAGWIEQTGSEKFCEQQKIMGQCNCHKANKNQSRGNENHPTAKEKINGQIRNQRTEKNLGAQKNKEASETSRSTDEMKGRRNIQGAKAKLRGNGQRRNQGAINKSKGKHKSRGKPRVQGQGTNARPKPRARCNECQYPRAKEKVKGYIEIHGAKRTRRGPEIQTGAKNKSSKHN